MTHETANGLTSPSVRFVSGVFFLKFLGILGLDLARKKMDCDQMNERKVKGTAVDGYLRLRVEFNFHPHILRYLSFGFRAFDSNLRNVSSIIIFARTEKVGKGSWI